MRAYFNGVEIDQIPELKEVCAMEDWLGGLLDWAEKNHPDKNLDAIVALEGPSLGGSPVLELWIGGAPAMRAMEIGGVMNSYSMRK